MAWSLSNTTSDLTISGGSFTRAIEKTPATAANVTTASIAAAGSYTAYWVTTSGEPGTSGTTGNYLVNVNVTTGSSNTGSVALTAVRVNSAGVVQTTGTTKTNASLAAAIKQFSWTSENLGTWASGDRLAFKVVVSNTGSMSTTITFTPGTDKNGVVRPWDPNLAPCPEAINLWSGAVASTVTADATTAPDGTTTADKLAETATTNYHLVVTDQSTSDPVLPLTSGTTYTVSIFWKAAERDAAVIELAINGSGGFDIWFSPAANTSTIMVQNGPYASTTLTRSIQAYANGWYRLSVTFVCASTGNHYVSWFVSKSTSSSAITDSNYLGTAGSGIYLWGSVVEAASSASDYPGVTSGVTLSPSLFTNTNTFYAATVTPGVRTLSPSLFTNSQTFNTDTLTASYTLSPSLYTNSQTFYNATVTPGVRTLSPSLFSNTQTFYAATITPGVVNLSPSLYTNTQTFYAPTLTASITLSPPLYTNTQTFYSATVTPGTVTLSPSLYTNTQAFYNSTLTSSITLSPSLYSNTQSFFSPTVTASITLSPSLYTNTQTFYSATVIPGQVTLSPSLYTNTQTLYSPTVSSGASTLSPSLYTNSQTFYTHTLSTSYTVSPSLYTNTQPFYNPTLSASIALTPGLFTNTNTFYAPTVSASYTLSPSLYTNSQVFYAATITVGTATLSPSLFTNTQTFYQPIISLGSGTQTLGPNLFTNSQVFYAASIVSSISLSGSLYTNTQSFYSPSVQIGAVSLSPPLYGNANVFYGPTIDAGTVAESQGFLFLMGTM